MDDSRMQAAFNLFDKDGDGKINEDEMSEVLKTLGRKCDKAAIREMIGGNVEGIFTARGGAVDFETFKSIIVRRRCATAPILRRVLHTSNSCHMRWFFLILPYCCACVQNGEIKGNEEITDLQEAFRLLDKHHNGWIDDATLQRICRALGEDMEVDEVRAPHAHTILMPVLQPSFEAGCVQTRLLHLGPIHAPSPAIVAHASCSLSPPRCHCHVADTRCGRCRSTQVKEMVGEALIGYEGQIYYDGLLKILITQ